VLILTAADGEPEALRAVENGAEGLWEKRHLRDQSWTYDVRTYRRKDGRSFEVALAHARRMGETTAAAVATRFVAELKPSILAMCGVCAGRPGWTSLGDVVIADMIYKYDAGEQVRTATAGPAHFKTDGISRDLPRQWRDLAQDFAQAFLAAPEGAALAAERPWPREHAELWLLDALDRGIDPAFGGTIHLASSAWTAIIDHLLSVGQVTMDAEKLVLLAPGRERLALERTRRANNLSPPPWRIHVRPFGTGSALIRDVDIWNRLSDDVRLIHALDMEGAALGEVGWLERIEPTLVVKGVMDFAEPDRPQHMRAFAARAAAETLIAFLRTHIELHGRQADDVLETGIAERPPHATNPGSLLHPRYREIDFVASVRTRELDELRDWCASPAQLAARLFHGPGGTGKTRLLIEWTHGLRKQDWNAGFLPLVLGEGDLEFVLDAQKPTFVVVDYAEARTDLLDLMRRFAGRNAGGRLRVVLLAREVADWWKRLLSSDAAVEALLRAHEPTPVTPVPLEGTARADVFQAAVRKFSRLLGREPAADTVPRPNLSDNRFGRTLYLTMAALAAVEGRPIHADVILADTLARERRFWLHRFERELPSSLEARGAFEDQMSRLMAAVTLRGGVPRGADAERLQRRVRGPESSHVLAWLASVYPQRIGPNNDRVSAIAPLEPDLLGEQLVLEVLNHHDTPSSFLDEVFAESDPITRTTGFLVLGRLGVRRGSEGDVGGWIERLVGDDPVAMTRPALTALLALRAETAHAPIGPSLARKLTESGGTSALAHHIDDLLPQDEPSVSLLELRAWAAQRLLNALDASPEPEQATERARILNNLGNRLRELGQREKALAATAEAATSYRTLVQTRPDAFLPNLAASLNNLGAMLSELGRREEALAATAEAVTSYRTLVQTRPDAFLPDLAMSLNNLGIRLSGLGRREEALAATAEAVTSYRTLVQTRPDAFLPDLAVSLSNLGISLSELGRREEALAATEEAATIRRTPAASRLTR
jgi:nucleoside phosphorylase/Tfp pilus assembly protein PilF